MICNRRGVAAVLLASASLGNTALAQNAEKQKAAPKAVSSSASAVKSLSLGQPVEGDVQDFVFLDAARPVFIRLHVQIDGVGFRKIWEKFVDRYFEFADTNRDGSLTNQEFQAAARSNVVPMSWADFDTAPRDGRVNRAEWNARLARMTDLNFTTGGQPAQRLRVAAGGNMMANRQNAGAELWSYLDRNADKVLTREEIAAAAQTLRKLDLDDDELISSTELRPYDSSLNYGVFATAAGMPAGQQSAAPNIAPITSQGNASAIARQLLERYDRGGKDGKLSREELGWEAAAFAAVDADKNGQLDAEELGQLARNPRPQLTLLVRLGQDAHKLGKFSLVSPSLTKGGKGGEVPPLTKGGPGGVSEKAGASGLIRDNGDGTLTVDFDTVHLHVSAGSTWSYATDQKFYEQQFQQADQDNNKYLDKQEARRSFVAGQFEQMDRDGNGMIYLEEIVTFYKQQTEITQSRVTLSGIDQGKLLFDVMDANRDGQLSPRELAEAPAKLPRWDRNGDGKLVSDEIPYQYAISIGRGGGTGQYGAAVLVAFAPGGMPRPMPGALPMGTPAWFQKMDRNRDGDLTPREFLGPAEDFKRLDTNGDGLISPQEAAAAR